MTFLKIGQLVQFHSTLLQHDAIGTIYKHNNNSCTIEITECNLDDKERVHILNNRIIINNKDILSLK